MCPELFVDERVTLLLGGLSTLLEDMVIVWVCPESLDDVIENELLSSTLGDVESEPP